MKRGPGPARRTGLTARTGLHRTSELPRAGELPRTVPAPRTPTAGERERAVAWTEIKRQAWDAWGGRCAVGRDPLLFETCHGHHRLMRSAGGPNTLANCLPVCSRCHQLIHEGGNASYDAGWLVRAWLLPEDVPVRGAWRRLG